MFRRIRGRWCLGRHVVSAITLLVFGVLASSCDRGDHPVRIDSRAPQFSVSDGSQTATLAEFHGRVVILNFWATWCIPCIEEVPSLVALQQKMPEVAVVAISSDQDQGAYRQFLSSYHVNFVTVRDPSERIPRLYGTVKIPESYVIDKRGILRRKFVSAQTWTNPEILNYLKQLEQ